jgi:hypothetical protein
LNAPGPRYHFGVVSAPPWYRDGLRFACTRCGNCCTGEPGSVRVSAEETAALARHVGLDLAAFHERFTRLLDDGTTSLTEKPDHECIFWSSDQGCTVYAVRPLQCRAWPFWRRNVASPAHWSAAARSCPGMDRGPLHDAAWIARTAANDGTSGSIPGANEP